MSPGVQGKTNWTFWIYRSGCASSSSWCRMWMRRLTSRAGCWAGDDAEDVAQEALLRAMRFFRGFNGGDARALAPANRPQLLLYVAGEESPNGTLDRIR